MSLALKIAIVEINQQRTMRFASTMSVYEACKQVAEKINITGLIIKKIITLILLMKY